jgi:uncharacterized SAM-binding protein YcdF (DUF218 family)
MRVRSVPHFTPRHIAAYRRSRRRFNPWKLVVMTLAIALSFHQMQIWSQRPQAVLILGGEPAREVFAAEFARRHPDLPIWVSSGCNRAYTEGVFSDAGVDPARLHLDYRAEDTVTNFTTLADQFQSRNIRSIYVITSDYHMRRAKVIGEIVLGSRGINFKPIAVPSDFPPETLDKTVRDGARSVLWVMTGKTGSAIAQFLHRF